MKLLEDDATSVQQAGIRENDGMLLEGTFRSLTEISNLIGTDLYSKHHVSLLITVSIKFKFSKNNDRVIHVHTML